MHASHSRFVNNERRSRREVLRLALLGAAGAAISRSAPQEKNAAALPRILLVGDSISMGYTEPVRRLLAAKADVSRIPENGGPTTNGLDHLSMWLGSTRWDVIHFNFGLHDIKLDAAGRNPQVSILQYDANLRELVKRLKATNAKLIWANTTPVPPVPWMKLDPHRRTSDVPFYNVVAQKVMQENAIPVNDLYSLALPKLETIQQPANVHFTEAGYEELAVQVAAAIATALASK
jgi:acyl-CoA thioesterase-1